MSNDNVIQLQVAEDEQIAASLKICRVARHKARVQNIPPEDLGNAMVAEGIATMFDMSVEMIAGKVLPAVISLSWEIITRELMQIAELDPTVSAKEIERLRAQQEEQRPLRGIERFGFSRIESAM